MSSAVITHKHGMRDEVGTLLVWRVWLARRIQADDPNSVSIAQGGARCTPLTNA